jgi:hypothetical protein
MPEFFKIKYQNCAKNKIKVSKLLIFKIENKLSSSSANPAILHDFSPGHRSITGAVVAYWVVAPLGLSLVRCLLHLVCNPNLDA